MTIQNCVFNATNANAARIGKQHVDECIMTDAPTCTLFNLAYNRTALF